MVTLARPASAAEREALARHGRLGWTLAGVGVLALGALVRVVLGGAGVGDRSAVALALIVSAAVWLGAWLINGPRAALLAGAVLIAAFDLAALPARNPPAYDDLQALYRTDQSLVFQAPVPAGQGALALRLLVRPVFDAAQPRFGLAADVNGTALNWTCAFVRGEIQPVALPIPLEALRGTALADVSLRLSGSPSRETDYLLVYASSRQGGVLVSLEPLAGSAPLEQPATQCTAG